MSLNYGSRRALLSTTALIAVGPAFQTIHKQAYLLTLNVTQNITLTDAQAGDILLAMTVEGGLATVSLTLSQTGALTPVSAHAAAPDTRKYQAWSSPLTATDAANPLSARSNTDSSMLNLQVVRVLGGGTATYQPGTAGVLVQSDNTTTTLTHPGFTPDVKMVGVVVFLSDRDNIAGAFTAPATFTLVLPNTVVASNSRAGQWVSTTYAGGPFGSSAFANSAASPNGYNTIITFEIRTL